MFARYVTKVHKQMREQTFVKNDRKKVKKIMEAFSLTKYRGLLFNLSESQAKEAIGRNCHAVLKHTGEFLLSI